MIFSSWANSEQTQYWAYEQTPPETIYHVIDYPYWSGYAGFDSTYWLPYRFFFSSYGNDILTRMAVAIV